MRVTERRIYSIMIARRGRFRFFLLGLSLFSLRDKRRVLPENSPTTGGRRNRPTYRAKSPERRGCRSERRTQRRLRRHLFPPLPNRNCLFSCFRNRNERLWKNFQTKENYSRRLLYPTLKRLKRVRIKGLPPI